MTISGWKRCNIRTPRPWSKATRQCKLELQWHASKRPRIGDDDDEEDDDDDDDDDEDEDKDKDDDEDEDDILAVYQLIN